MLSTLLTLSRKYKGDVLQLHRNRYVSIAPVIWGALHASFPSWALLVLPHPDLRSQQGRTAACISQLLRDGRFLCAL